MGKRKVWLVSGILLAVLLVLGACSGLGLGEVGVSAGAPARAGAAQIGTPTAGAPEASPAASAAVPSPSATSVLPAATAGVSAPLSSTIQSVPPALTAIEGTLQQVYAQVNPSVVNIQVIGSLSPLPRDGAPAIPGLPQNQIPQQGLGSGFVWDAQGDIVTNNHVVEGAQRISVTFFNGTTITGTVVSTDPDSDLAVVKVNAPAGQLRPVQLADSTQLKVGQLVAAIGNPFGFQGSMSVGIVSGLARSLPADNSLAGPSYSIPDIIQTDAAINPGNSGGVLVDMQGRVVGVTAAIESSGGSNSGVGFAIPSAIVQKVVPVLARGQTYQHPYLGISGRTLDPDTAQAMNLSPNQRGALVVTVVPGGPADKAGVQGSSRTATINGLQTPVGGDVITAIDGQTVNTFDDLVADLASNGQVGQNVTLTVLRNGAQQQLQATLAARPAAAPGVQATPLPGPRRTPLPQATPPSAAPATVTPAPTTAPSPSAAPATVTPVPTTSPLPSAAPATAAPAPTSTSLPSATPAASATATAAATVTAVPTASASAVPTAQVTGARAWLGIQAMSLTPDIARAMSLPTGQQGVLVVAVVMGSPADQAGIRGSFRSANIGGSTILVGGDVVTRIDSQTIANLTDLQTFLQSARPGQQVAVTYLRDGQQSQATVTLGQAPGSAP